jgi:hypothetical protein
VKEHEALQLEVHLAAQVARLSDLELTGRQSAAAAAASNTREEELKSTVLQLTDQLSSAADSAARQVAEAAAAVLEGASQQISAAEVSEYHIWFTCSYTWCCVPL